MKSFKAENQLNLSAIKKSDLQDQSASYRIEPTSNPNNFDPQVFIPSTFYQSNQSPQTRFRNNQQIKSEGKSNQISPLNLGTPKNYNSKIIEQRWQQERQKWLNNLQNNQSLFDLFKNGSTQSHSSLNSQILLQNNRSSISKNSIQPSAEKEYGSQSQINVVDQAKIINKSGRDGNHASSIPQNHSIRLKRNMSISLRRHVKNILKQEIGPYEPFESYFPLKQVVVAYNEVWFRSDTTESEEYYCEECSCCYSILSCACCCKQQYDSDYNLDETQKSQIITPQLYSEKQLNPREVIKNGITEQTKQSDMLKQNNESRSVALDNSQTPAINKSQITLREQKNLDKEQQQAQNNEAFDEYTNQQNIKQYFQTKN